MIPENERARRGKAPLYKTNAHKVPRGRGHSRRGRAAHATQIDKKPPTPYYLPCRRICQTQSSANEPPHHKRVRTGSAKVLLDLREDARGLAQTGGRFTSSHPCRCEGSSQGPREGSRAQEAPAPARAAARSRLFPIQETTWPQGFPPWGQERAPQQKEMQLCRESRPTRASRRRWGRASR